jgi:hypothetical protein
MELQLMLKNINHPHLFALALSEIERNEHGLKKAPTKTQMQQMEKKEHGLKRTPSMAEIMKIEMKEHIKPNGDVVIGRGFKGRAKAK